MADYKVNLELALVGGLAVALTKLTSQLKNINSLQGKINEGFKGWEKAIGAAGAAIAGSLLLKGINDLAKAGGKLIDVREQLKMQGADLVELEKDYAKAVELTSKFKNFTISQTMDEIRNLRYSTGHPKEALDFLPDMMRLQTILQATGGPNARLKTDQTQPIMRALEQLGLIGTGRDDDARKVIEGMTRASIATGGRVTPAQMFQTMLYARSAKYGWASDEALKDPNGFMYNYLPHLMQEYASPGGGAGGGGLRGPGNALMTMFARIGAGNYTLKNGGLNKQGRALDDIGLVEQDKEGNWRAKGSDLAAKNPYEWVQQYLAPALKSKGIEGQAGITEAVKKITEALGVRTAADVATNMLLQGRSYAGAENSPFEKTRRLQDQTMGPEEALKAAQGMPRLVDESFHAQWNRMWEAIGSAITPDRLEVIKKITDVFTQIGSWSVNPENAKHIRAIAEAIAVVAAGFMVLAGGAVLATIMAAFGVGGWFVLGLTALSAIVVSIKNYWTDIKESFDAAVVGRIREAIQTLGSAVNSVIGWFSSIAGAIQGILGIDPNMKKQDVTPNGMGGGLTPLPMHPFPGGGGGAPPAQRQSWEPGSGGGGGGETIQIHNVVNLDGSTIARSINDYSLGETAHPRQAGYFDGRETFSSSDSQFAST